jgi:uncharacterized protein (TIGR03435 family)
MQHKIRVFLCAGLAAAALGFFAPGTPAQTAAPRPEFDVASIKPAQPLTPALIQSGRFRAGMNIDGAQVNIGSIPILALLPQAFNLKQYQIIGGGTVADAAAGQRWDILAKIPQGASQDQVPDMLVKLLEDRFGMKYHHEKREMQVYALIIGKTGLKLKDTSSETDAPLPDAPGAVMMNSTNGQQIRINQQAARGGGQGGLATISSPQYGTMTVNRGEGGNMHLQASKMTMAGMSDLLTGLVDHPVLDMTDLKGTYQVTLDVSMETIMALARAQGMAGAAGGGQGGPPGGPGGANVTVPTASDPGGGSAAVFDAVQKLGLKLDARKAPVDVIVIDHLDKNPTDN